MQNIIEIYIIDWKKVRRIDHLCENIGSLLKTADFAKKNTKIIHIQKTVELLSELASFAERKLQKNENSESERV